MEDSVVLVEGLRKSDSVASTSKIGSLVQINSIAIDICSFMEVIEPPKHEHFSIRGFVVGMRKKNRKTGFPFASEGNDIDMVDNLPPLSVPSFRWWQCSTCIPQNETKRTTTEMVVATSNAGSDSCPNVGDINGPFLHSRENTGNRIKTDTTDKGEGNSCDVPEDNPLQIVEIVNNSNNTTDASDIVRVVEQPLCISDKPDNASPGSDGTLNALPHKRKPKLRSLADIMMTERNPNGENPRTRSTSSCGTQVTSTEMEAVLSPQPELHVTVNVEKDATSPERKRKINVREDGEPLKVIYPSAAAKRIKGLMIDAEKNCRGVEVLESESEGDALMKLDSKRMTARTQHIKPKKTKAPGISKKMKHIQKDSSTAPTRKIVHTKDSCSADLQKHPVPLEINFGKFGCSSSTAGDAGLCFRSFQSGKQMENTFTSKMPQVRADHDYAVTPRKSNLGDCNLRGKVALDLSLYSFMDSERDSNNHIRHRGLPDLNEEPLEKTTVTQAQQLIIHSDRRSLPLHKTLDVRFSYSNETSREGKRQQGISELDNKEQGKELGASDDIPMEIVELLAKNQRERALENSRSFFGLNNSTRGYSAQCADGHSSMIDYPLNRSSGVTVRNGSMGIRQNIPPNFSQLNNYRWGLNRAEESLLWSSTREDAPFHLNVAPKHTTQPNNMRGDSFLNRKHKGKIINDGKEKRAAEGRMGAISTSLGSMDPYSNNTIPAMQLLSLMDQRVVRGSSLEVGGKNVNNKHFSPCSHHSRLNEKETQQRSHGSRLSVHFPGESSKKGSSSLRDHLVQKVGKSKAIGLATSELALGVCSLNRNPADFSIPDARNKFTITAKDLKFRKRSGSKGKAQMVNVEGKKRRERVIRKDASGKEF